MKKIILILCMILLLCGCVDGATKIGLDRLNWSQSLPSGEGIKFSGTAPAVTTDKLYSDGGVLKFGDRTISDMQTIYAQDYGVVPDDDIDDSAALQAALNAGRRKIIQLPEGEINVVNTTITIAGDLEFCGTGRATTVINMTGPLSKFLLTGNRVIIRDMFLHATDYTSLHGIYVNDDVHYWEIDNCWIKGFGKNTNWNSPGAGIYISDSCYIGLISNSLIDTCFIGVYGDGSSLNALSLHNLRTNVNIQDGIYFEAPSSHGIVLSDCSAEGNGRNGILLSNVQQALVEGCYLGLNAYSGLFVSGTDDNITGGIVTISGNTFYENGASNNVASLECYEVNRTLIMGNRFAEVHSAIGAIRLSESPLVGKNDQKVATLIENRYDEITGDGAGVYVTNIDYAVIIDSRRQGGTTAHRPAVPTKYETYFDSTLGKLIVYDGSAWKNVDGTSL